MAWTDLPGINDSQDGVFGPQFQSLLQQMIASGNYSDAQIQQAIQSAPWYGQLGSGSNPYAAAKNVADILGATTPGQVDQSQLSAYNQAAVDRSPEGQARANDSGGGVGSFLPLLLAGGALAMGQPELLAMLSEGGAGAGLLDAGTMAGLSADATAGLRGAGELSNIPALTSGAGSGGGLAGSFLGTSGAAAAGGGFDLGGGLSVDEFGNTTGGLFQGGPGTPGAGDFFSGGASGLNFANGLPGGLADAFNMLKGLPAGVLNTLGLGNLTGSGSSGGGPSLGSTIPGLLALAYAKAQPGIDTSQLSGVLSSLQGNQNAVIQAATDPLQKNIAAGYGDLVQSQGLRGIRGSSFGDTDIANYIATTGRSLSNAGANAAEGSLALQGNLAGNLAQLQNQAQQQKNSLYGRAFDVLGRGLNPKGYSGSTINLGSP